ncbi:MAG TPA: ComEA family DNA-binding protein [Tahibacter sp.]|uniref:ComEA family DNA-binding protein n=1 Tax=Tahibacter sp. TaxID=2056211 RepID=UPI002B8578B0|nr:ComEA family DNA-binding protein [Tahibacter sp.]HSX60457.1 ComEA family DNA-binding protein [Tahibacter sp.]
MNRFIQALALSLAFCFPAFAAQPVNVNTADAGTIASNLKGVGQSKAEAIVAYREKNGAFKSVDDLAKVKGIGEKTVAANRELILVEGGSVKAKPAANGSGG